MNLTRLSIKKPASVFILIIAILAFGVYGYLNMPLNLMPNIEYPIVTVVTSLPGASAVQVDEQVSQKITDKLSTLAGVKEISTSSMDSFSVIAIGFNYGIKLDEAIALAEEKLKGIDIVLPDDASLPAVAKVDISSMPSVTAAVSGDMSIVSLTKLVNDEVVPRISKLEGVASVSFVGGQEKEVFVKLDPEKAASNGISQELVAGIIMGYNKSIPLGQTTYDKEKISIRSETPLTALSSIEEIKITKPDGSKVKLKDICTVSLDSAAKTTISRYDGNTNINIAVHKKNGANTLEVVSRVKDEISSLTNEDNGLTVAVINDESRFIMLAVNNVWSNLIVGGVLAMLVLLLFLRSLRASIIVGSAIPLSVVAAVCLMYAFGVPLNMVSIGGMAIGVGMVVDNAIVVSESIYRYRSDGMTVKKAALLGCKLVAGAITASTITTVAVFIPIMFTEGLTKEIFTQLSLTITFSLLSSLLIAVTVIPTLTATVSVKQNGRFKLYTAFDNIMSRAFSAMERGYGRFVGFILNKKTVVILLAIVLFGSSLMLIPLIGTEFLPTSDQGQVNIEVEVLDAKVLADSEAKSNEIEQILKDNKEIDRVLTTIGDISGFIQSKSDPSIVKLNCFLKPSNERTATIEQVGEEIRQSLTGVTGVNIRVTEVNSLIDSMFSGASSMSAPVAIDVTADTKETLESVVADITSVVEKTEGVINTKTNLAKRSNEIIVSVDPQKAMDKGLTVMQVTQVLRNAVSGIQTGSYSDGDGSYDVTVKYADSFTNSISKLKKLMLQTPMGVSIPLSEVAVVTTHDAPQTIVKQGLQYKASISAFVVGRDSGSVNSEIQAEIDKLELPDDVTLTAAGQQSLMLDSIAGLTVAIIFSICIVYVVLAVQFNSFKNPFIIMMSLPFAFSGSLLLLWFTKVTLNMTSMIGLIILVGIVVNNAIVYIDRVNSLRDEGRDIKRAIVMAGETRLRPILMTALTTILGLMPVAFASGEGAEIMAPMALTVIGGLVTSTLLTLVIIPVLYATFNRKEMVIDRSDEI